MSPLVEEGEARVITGCKGTLIVYCIRNDIALYDRTAVICFLYSVGLMKPGQND
jgi:hypothetical protein